MKKGILILLGMFMMVSTAEAKNGNNLPNSNRFYYSYDNAVNFVERGVEFFIFPNGEFDFDVLSNNRFNLNIDRNFRGQIRRIGNVRISYDIFNNVTRIGDVFLRYQRGRLIRVGNLNVNYNRWNEPIFSGFVRDNFYVDNGIRFNLNLGITYNFNDRFFFRNDFNRNYRQIREDRNFFYYKANRRGNVANNSIIKRRKSTADIARNRSNINQRSEGNRSRNFTYRKSNTDNERNIDRRKSTVNTDKTVTRRNPTAATKPAKRVVKSKEATPRTIKTTRGTTRTTRGTSRRN